MVGDGSTSIWNSPNGVHVGHSPPPQPNSQPRKGSHTSE
jgi:hypothetical protein